ncbi:MAG: Uma2 family endonuclease [Hyphomicrobiaceae bacterium]|nr:Uma2 family endonuclease [Hyphomicrobiaceae bacterium]
MPTKLAEKDQMTIEEFLAFTGERPDGGHWELIEGVAFMSPSPTDWHQFIVTNVVTWLANRKTETRASWFPLVGVGTIVPVSPNSLPQPDVMVKEHPGRGSHVSEDALVVLEILSRSNTKTDRAWRRRVYASIPNCQHYVTISTERAEAVCYARADGWIEHTSRGLRESIELAAIDASIPLRDIYRFTPIE